MLCSGARIALSVPYKDANGIDGRYRPPFRDVPQDISGESTRGLDSANPAADASSSRREERSGERDSGGTESGDAENGSSSRLRQGLEVDVKELPDKKDHDLPEPKFWELRTPITYRARKHDFTVAPSMHTDFASVSRMFVWFLPRCRSEEHT